MTKITELKKQAKEKGIKGFSTMNKAQLLKELNLPAEKSNSKKSSSKKSTKKKEAAEKDEKPTTISSGKRFERGKSYKRSKDDFPSAMVALRDICREEGLKKRHLKRNRKADAENWNFFIK